MLILGPRGFRPTYRCSGMVRKQSMAPSREPLVALPGASERDVQLCSKTLNPVQELLTWGRNRKQVSEPLTTTNCPPPVLEGSLGEHSEMFPYQKHLINGYPQVIHRLSTDYPRVIHELSADYPHRSHHD